RRLLRVGAVAVVLGAATLAATVIPYIQQLRLRASRRETQWTQAAMGLEQGIASHFTGRIAESRQAFAVARDAFGRLGVSTLPAEVGLYRSVREFDAPINTVQASSDGLMSVAFLPDGHRAAATAEDGTVRLWDLRTGEALRDFVGHEGLVGALAVSPDGRRLLTGGLDQFIRLWDVETGQLLREMLEPTGEVRGVAFAPDGKLALTGSYCKDATLRLWDLQTGEQLRTYRRPTDPSHYYGVAFSPDGRRVLATTYGRDIWVWDVDHEDPRQQLAGHAGYVVSATFSPDGRHVLSGSFDQTIRLWDLQTGKAEVFTGHAAGVRGAAFADAGTVLSASMDGTIKLWDVPSRQVRRTFAGHIDGVRGLSISPDGRRAASAGIDGTVRVWNLAPNNEVQSADERSTVITLSGSSDGHMLVAGTSSGAVTLRDVATLRTLQPFAGHDRPIECAAFLPSGRLFTADDAGQARVWDIASGRVLQTYSPRMKPDDDDARVRGDDWCHTAVAASGGVAIASNPDRRRIDVWSIETGQTLRTLAGSVNNVTCLTISADGRRALSGDAFGRMYCWNLDAGTVRFRTEPSKRGTLDCVRFAPDGKTALSGGHDNTVRLWDLESGRQLRAYPGHTLVVRAADFGRDGRTVFSAGSDQALRMFDRETGRAFDLGAQFALPLYAMAVIPPGDAVAAAAGRTISVWNVSRAARHV
ncbi:MAG: WD40 repeat domain-containing protein, partial [Tepidisphaeraceae bacterium]